MTNQPYAEYGPQFANIYDQIFPGETVSGADIQWLMEQIPADRPRVLELGVGTGRVALPLQAALVKRGGPPNFVGVDVSTEMLAQLRANDVNEEIELRLADIAKDPLGQDEYDTVLCLCATISMLTDKDQQQAAFHSAARALKPSGRLVVETHNARVVQAMNPEGSGVYAVPYPGGKRVLVTFSRLSGNQWAVEHCWIADGEATFAEERSRMTTLDELDAYAIQAGLVSVGHTAGLAGTSITGDEPTVTATYQKPA